MDEISDFKDARKCTPITLIYQTTEDNLDGSPWPPDGNDHWCIVDRANGRTKWRRIFLKKSPAKTSLHVQQITKAARAALMAGDRLRITYGDDSTEAVEQWVNAMMESTGARVTCEDPWGETPWVELELPTPKA